MYSCNSASMSLLLLAGSLREGFTQEETRFSANAMDMSIWACRATVSIESSSIASLSIICQESSAVERTMYSVCASLWYVDEGSSESDARLKSVSDF